VLLFVGQIPGLVGDAAHEVRVEADPVAPQAQVIAQQKAPGFAPDALAQGQAIDDGGADHRDEQTRLGAAHGGVAVEDFFQDTLADQWLRWTPGLSPFRTRDRRVQRGA